MSNPDRNYFVYMMRSASRRALYIGVTSKIKKRVFQHKNHQIPGFSDENSTTRLVYMERYRDMRSAISREKQLKGWRREKKNKLIEAMNPTCRDLAQDWFERDAKQTQGPSTAPDAGASGCAQDDESQMK